MMIMVSIVHNRAMMVLWRFVMIDMWLDMCHCVMDEMRLLERFGKMHIVFRHWLEIKVLVNKLQSWVLLVVCVSTLYIVVLNIRMLAHMRSNMVRN